MARSSSPIRAGSVIAEKLRTTTGARAPRSQALGRFDAGDRHLAGIRASEGFEALPLLEEVARIAGFRLKGQPLARDRLEGIGLRGVGGLAVKRPAATVRR